MITEIPRVKLTHVFAPRSRAVAHANLAAAAVHPQFNKAGQTANFIVSYDARLGASGLQAAKSILQTCEGDFQTLRNVFSGTTPPDLPFQIRLTTDNTGAEHATCAATELFIGANSGDGPVDLAFMRQLVIAEEDEVFMEAFGRGWNCGFSNGEGLSRVLANDMVPGAEPPNFISSNTWLNDGRPNWVDNTEQDDTKYPSIGCSVLFLNWLRFQLKYPWQQIIAAGADTLAKTYTNLSGQDNGFVRFKAFMDEKFPPNQAATLTTDNPFPL
ncbi:MAG TPA: hypothetical protein VIX89_11175 [Bryobacteraceae bacterium]